MSTLHIDMSAGEADRFVESNPGFETAPGANIGDALFPEPPASAGKTNPLPDIQASDMPKPWPPVIGFDGMPRGHEGAAMKAEGGRWVPVSRFDPPFSDEDQAELSRQAEAAYVDRCAEFAVNGAAA